MKENKIDLIQLDSPPSKPEAKGEAAVPQEEKGAPKPRNIKILITLVVGFVLLGGGMGAALYLGWLSIPGISSGGKNTVVSSSAEIGSMVKMSPLIINLKEENGNHYIKTSMVLEIGQKDWVEEVQSRVPLLTDLAILTLSEKRLEELKSSGAKENLKKELLMKINQSLDSLKVKQIYFDEFLYQ
jgi:flagellar basal body-associated protein FliL